MPFLRFLLRLLTELSVPPTGSKLHEVGLRVSVALGLVAGAQWVLMMMVLVSSSLST